MFYHTIRSEHLNTKNLGIEYPLANVPTPTKERVDNARKILNAK